MDHLLPNLDLRGSFCRNSCIASGDENPLLFALDGRLSLDMPIYYLARPDLLTRQGLLTCRDIDVIDKQKFLFDDFRDEWAHDGVIRAEEFGPADFSFGQIVFAFVGITYPGQFKNGI
jgi:hypothetical protein